MGTQQQQHRQYPYSTYYNTNCQDEDLHPRRSLRLPACSVSPGRPGRERTSWWLRPWWLWLWLWLWLGLWLWLWLWRWLWLWLWLWLYRGGRRHGHLVQQHQWKQWNSECGHLLSALCSHQWPQRAGEARDQFEHQGRPRQDRRQDFQVLSALSTHKLPRFFRPSDI